MTTELEILILGLSGLVFLLSAFSYKLLAKEQEKAAPCISTLKAIKQYLYVNLVLASLTFASAFIPQNNISSEIIKLEAITDFSNIDEGIAMVCQNADYLNRYLLVSDKITKRMVQVRADIGMPCDSDQQFILLNVADAKNLGWDLMSSIRNVNVVSALPGYKFVFDESRESVFDESRESEFEHASCQYNGSTYPEGAKIGLYVCKNGAWVEN